MTRATAGTAAGGASCGRRDLDTLIKSGFGAGCMMMFVKALYERSVTHFRQGLRGTQDIQNKGRGGGMASIYGRHRRRLRFTRDREHLIQGGWRPFVMRSLCCC